MSDEDKVFWLVRYLYADRSGSVNREWGYSIVAMDPNPSGHAITATEAVEDFMANRFREFDRIDVAPIAAPTAWDKFDVVPERLERRA